MEVLKFDQCHRVELKAIVSLLMSKTENYRILKTFHSSPDWCDSVGCMLSQTPKGPQFNSQSGQMPRLQV